MIQVTGLQMSAAMFEDAVPKTATRRDSARAEALAALEARAKALVLAGAAVTPCGDGRRNLYPKRSLKGGVSYARI